MRPSVQYLLECYSGGKFAEISENLERSGVCEDYANWKLNRALLYILLDGSDSPVPTIVSANAGRNGGHGHLNFTLRQNIRELARKLKSTADALEIKPGSALLSVERAILVNEDLNQDEMLVVRSILSERTPTTVPNIAEHLKKYMTARTFQAALRYLCYSVSTIPEELALACELVKATYPDINMLSWADSIYEVINEFIENKLDNVLH